MAWEENMNSGRSLVYESRRRGLCVLIIIERCASVERYMFKSEDSASTRARVMHMISQQHKATERLTERRHVGKYSRVLFSLLFYFIEG